MKGRGAEVFASFIVTTFVTCAIRDDPDPSPSREPRSRPNCWAAPDPDENHVAALMPSHSGRAHEQISAPDTDRRSDAGSTDRGLFVTCRQSAERRTLPTMSSSPFAKRPIRPGVIPKRRLFAGVVPTSGAAREPRPSPDGSGLSRRNGAAPRQVRPACGPRRSRAAPLLRPTKHSPLPAGVFPPNRH